jgi:hypothetical protein
VRGNGRRWKLKDIEREERATLAKTIAGLTASENGENGDL